MSELRGIRGATTVERDDAELVKAATAELLRALLEANGLAPADIVSVLFSATADIRSAFPAAAARDLGWTDVPLFCCQEMAVDGALPLCIRVLVHARTARPAHGIHHLYLRGARVLRPDLVEGYNGGIGGVLSK